VPHLSPETSCPPHLLQLKHFRWNTDSPALMTSSFAGIGLPQLPQTPLLPNILQQDTMRRSRSDGDSRWDLSREDSGELLGFPEDLARYR